MWTQCRLSFVILSFDAIGKAQMAGTVWLAFGRAFAAEQMKRRRRGIVHRPSAIAVAQIGKRPRLGGHDGFPGSKAGRSP